MKPRRLYTSADSAFTMLAETIGGAAAEELVRNLCRDDRQAVRRLSLRCGELGIGECLVMGDVASEVLRIEETLAAMLETVGDERYGTHEPTPL